jgi:peptidyl-prolyl cis-trans isomerase C
MTTAHDISAAPAARPRQRLLPSEAVCRRVVRAAEPIVQHRLFQFAVLGGILFAAAPSTRSPESIDIAGDRLAALRAAEVARPGTRALSGEVAPEVDERAIEDEVLYREGIRLGLDKNDGIVRQRVVQKVLFLAEEIAGATRPAQEADLRVFFEHNRERWAVGERVRFAQIYRHRPEELAAWAAGSQIGDPPLAEPCAVAAEIDEDRQQLTTHMGAGFAEALAAVPEGRWAGPIQSAFGWHLVRVLERRPGRPARLEEVRGAVLEAYSVFRRQEATAAFLQAAFARYRVSVDGKPIGQLTPSRRVAFRSVSSGED